ncbi:MAG: hypothetical protein IT462_03060 [Planctomycetes bacterium]|nr:hypothetical protein [Planctomycetota bacterium]
MAKWLASSLRSIAAILVAALVASCGVATPQRPTEIKHGPVVLPDPVEVYTYNGCLCAMELAGARVKALQKLFDECEWQPTIIERDVDDDIGLTWNNAAGSHTLYVYKNDSNPGLFFDSWKDVGPVGRKGLVAPPDVAKKFREIVVEARKEWEARTRRPIDPPKVGSTASLIEIDDQDANLPLSAECVEELQTILSKAKWATFELEHMHPKAEWAITWTTAEGKYILCVWEDWFEVLAPDHQCRSVTTIDAEKCRQLLRDFHAESKAAKDG